MITENIFRVYSITKEQLTQTQKEELLDILKKIYGDENVTINPDNDYSTIEGLVSYQIEQSTNTNPDSPDKMYRTMMVDFIKSKYNDKGFIHVVEYNILLPDENLMKDHDFNDGILTKNEEKISRNLLSTSFTLSDRMGGTDRFIEEYHHGYGLVDRFVDRPVEGQSVFCSSNRASRWKSLWRSMKRTFVTRVTGSTKVSKGTKDMSNCPPTETITPLSFSSIRAR